MTWIKTDATTAIVIFTARQWLHELLWQSWALNSGWGRTPIALTLFRTTLTISDAHYGSSKGSWERKHLGQVPETLHRHHNESCSPSRTVKGFVEGPMTYIGLVTTCLTPFLSFLITRCYTFLSISIYIYNTMRLNDTPNDTILLFLRILVHRIIS